MPDSDWRISVIRRFRFCLISDRFWNDPAEPSHWHKRRSKWFPIFWVYHDYFRASFKISRNSPEQRIFDWSETCSPWLVQTRVRFEDCVHDWHSLHSPHADHWPVLVVIEQGQYPHPFGSLFTFGTVPHQQPVPWRVIFPLLSITGVGTGKSTHFIFNSTRYYNLGSVFDWKVACNRWH